MAASPLAHVVEQLWQPAIDTGRARVDLGRSTGSDEDDYLDVERYRVLPSVGRAGMLIPTGPREATVGALLNFRGLRRRVPNVQRSLLGAAARTGQLPFPIVRLRVRAGQPCPATPLAAVAVALGRQDLAASIGINTGANRKATLHVISSTGTPVGFAKFAWDPVSTASVRWEAAALRELGGGDQVARAPALLAVGDYYGRPFMISAPLPLDSLGVRAGVSPPTARELYSLLPLARRDRLAATGQYAAVRDRLHTLTPLGQDMDRVVAEARAVLDTLAEDQVEAVVQQRWHGDLAAWNTARSADGVLWLWDWESSETDAVAGLDAIHWHMSTRTETGRPWNGAALVEALELARPLITAAGTPRAAGAGIAALYAATIAERACTLAAGAGGWESGWLPPEGLLDMLVAARRLQETAG